MPPTLEKLYPNLQLPHYGGVDAKPNQQRRPAVFLDRDGVIVKDVDFVTEPGQLIVLPGASEAIKLLSSRYYIIVVTNQSGIGRGLMTEHDLWEVHTELLRRLWLEGAKLDGLYYCPHHPTLALGEYLVACECRKPKPGMLNQAADRWDLDLAGSILVGDRDSDVEAAHAAGVKPFTIGDGASVKHSDVTAVSSLLEAAHVILNDEPRPGRTPIANTRLAGGINQEGN